MRSERKSAAIEGVLRAGAQAAVIVRDQTHADDAPHAHMYAWRRRAVPSSTPTWSSCPCSKTTTSPMSLSLAQAAGGEARPRAPRRVSASRTKRSCFGTQGAGWQAPRVAARRRRRAPASCSADTLRRLATAGGLAARGHRLGRIGHPRSRARGVTPSRRHRRWPRASCWPTTTAPRYKTADHARAWLDTVELRVSAAARRVEAALDARRDSRRGHQPGARAGQRAGQPPDAAGLRRARRGAGDGGRARRRGARRESGSPS